MVYEKIKLVNLFLGIIIAVFTVYGGNWVYQQLFTITNYEIKSEDIEITELYQLDNNIIYFTVKSNEPYFVGSAKFITHDTEGISASVGLSRTIVPKRANIDDDKSTTFIVNIENGNVEFYNDEDDSYNNEEKRKENLESLVNELKIENTGVNKNIKNIYYIGKNQSDKLLIWEEGMVLPQYPN